MIERTIQKLVRNTPFEDFRRTAEDFAADHHDVVVDSRSIACEAGDTLRYTTREREVNNLFNGQDGIVTVGGDCEFTKHAFQQLSERLDAPPTRWALNKAGDSLRADVMNAVIRHRESTSLMLRQDGNTLRAVLSDQYSAFNHTELLDLIAGAIETKMGEVGKEIRVFKGQIGDVMRGYVLLPNVTFARDPRANGQSEHGEGDQLNPGSNGGLHPAIYVTNSEIGTGKVRIHGGLYSSVCDNGAIYGWNEKIGLELIHRHVSRRTIASAVADSLVAAFELSEKMAHRFIYSQMIFLEPTKIEKLADSWAEKYGLTLESTEAWENMIEVEAAQNQRRGAPALFDAVNAVTFSAQNAIPDEAEVMERIGGDLLFAELPVEYLTLGQRE